MLFSSSYDNYHMYCDIIIVKRIICDEIYICFSTQLFLYYACECLFRIITVLIKTLSTCCVKLTIQMYKHLYQLGMYKYSKQKPKMCLCSCA